MGTKKIDISSEELTEWMNTTWHLYASQMYNDKLLRVWVSTNSEFQVSHGEDILYKGPDMGKALAAWYQV